ncbi:FAD-dependent oxidoreductase [Helicobacter sp. 13S00401-1]|uniref:FAD-dependent oxidoreductase n=1 Tax=Helicobacter sp. 13S00401-1 TaxID=1905758 RepID=UPI001551F129|nr:FAD-dependent oxidoreductase [Helicobacter sp. 13S00401-1]
MMNSFDVVIVGGGVSGASTFYTLSEYSDLGSIAIVEKEAKLANISSSAKANSQTIHDGSIETNYKVEKARVVKLAADKVKNFALRENLQNKVIFKNQKMAIGVGDSECQFIQDRHFPFEEVFPGLKLFTKEDIKRLEPKVIEGKDGKDRPENVMASGYEEAWCAMNYELLTHHFAQKGKEKNPKNEIFLNFKVKEIKEVSDGYKITAHNGECLHAKFVLVNAGSYALPIAQSMGYGNEYGCLPVAGSFYFVPDLLRGKVYGVQNPKLPFAALHGDPDVAIHGKTRIGPTALAMPKLERGKHLFSKIGWELLELDLNKEAIAIMFDLLKDQEIRDYVFRNMAFELPFAGIRMFLKDAQKIIPTLKLRDLTYAKGFGEVRPQVLDRKKMKLELGEKKIKSGKGITFNMTPSPGATSCLQNAFVDSQEITSYLNKNFDKVRFLEELNPIELESK